MSNLEVAKKVITCYLSTGSTIYALNDMYEITHGNKDVLLGHLKALKNIFEEAIKELGDDKNE